MKSTASLGCIYTKSSGRFRRKCLLVSKRSTNPIATPYHFSQTQRQQQKYKINNFLISGRSQVGRRSLYAFCFFFCISSRSVRCNVDEDSDSTSTGPGTGYIKIFVFRLRALAGPFTLQSQMLFLWKFSDLELLRTQLPLNLLMYWISARGRASLPTRWSHSKGVTGCK